MIGGGPGSGLIIGPLIVAWGVYRLVAYLSDSFALLGEHPRGIRPDEFAPMSGLRTRMVLVTLGYLVVILFGGVAFVVALDYVLA
ncbi:MAG: hypothetical protein Q8S43_07570 [Actinomycetota bacterium]|nr:hypothetical protein [Caldisericota bacterium]MDP3630793.1 hypothetical protein [Actinomycetota bacterium]